MLMADERSDLWNFEDLTAGTDFGGFDINCLLDLMDDRPDPVQVCSDPTFVVIGRKIRMLVLSWKFRKTLKFWLLCSVV